MINGFALIGNAIASRIVGGTYSVAPGLVARKNQIYWESERDDDIKVYVAPIEQQFVSPTRSGPQRQYVFGIYVIGKIDHSDITAQDQMSQLLDEIEERLLTAETIAGYPIQVDTETTRIPMDPEAALASVFLSGFQVAVIT